MNYTVRMATLDDADNMALCHTDAFPNQFMTVMGLKWLAALYSFYIEHENGVSIIAVNDNGAVVGLAVGGDTNIRGEFLSLAKKKYIFRLFWKFLTKKIVRTKILGQVFGRKTTLPPEVLLIKKNEVGFGVLLSIGVKSEYVGKGVAGSVMTSFIEACSKLYKNLRLSVHSDNDRAIAFYKKYAWREVYDDGDSKGFHYKY